MPTGQVTRNLLLPFCLAILALAQATPLAASTWQSRAHADCLLRAVADPASALETALTWEAEGGGAAALHCAATALVAMGAYADGARRFEALAALAPDESPTGRASLLAEAGNAWVLADDLPRALAAFDAAIVLVDTAPSLFVDRALAHALSGDLWAAIDDLNRAEDLEPDRLDVLVFRASAYRMLEVYDLAGADLERALELDPRNAEAWLEMGHLRHAEGDLDAARHGFLQALRIESEGPMAEAARQAIEAIELGAGD